MARKTTQRIDIEGKVFEAQLERAKELFGSHNYQISFYDERIAFVCIASPSQVIDAWRVNAKFTIQTLDKRKGAYVDSLDLEHVLEAMKGEQFIYCIYWIVLNA